MSKKHHRIPDSRGKMLCILVEKAEAQSPPLTLAEFDALFPPSWPSGSGDFYLPGRVLLACPAHARWGGCMSWPDLYCAHCRKPKVEHQSNKWV